MADPIIIEIVPLGNLANRIIQYLVALKLQDALPGAILSNIQLPELELVLPLVEYDATRSDSLTIEVFEYVDVERIIVLARTGAFRHLRLGNYCQIFANLPPLDRCRAVLAGLSEKASAPTSYGDDTIVINVRASEILDGVAHYPLLPIAFYRDIVALSGRKPVFMGQIDDSDYCLALKRAFPTAGFVASAGLYNDFESMRSCRHLVIPASTFSWLAAWLSTAETIVLPMVGFFNPCFMPDTDLLPLDDPRFQFWSFPFYFGLPSPEFLAFQHRLDGSWRRETADRIRHIRSARPLLPRDPLAELALVDPDATRHFFSFDYRTVGYAGPFNSFFDRLATQTSRIMHFDEFFYVHEYPDAGRDITDGWYEDAFRHYVQAGRRMGYLPRQRDLPNIVRGVESTASSVASELEGSAAEQAARATDGAIATGCALRTAVEDQPWWMVDLGREHLITDFYVHYGNDSDGLAHVVTPLDVEFSTDGKTWQRVRRWTERNQTQRWYPRPGMSSRYVRLIARAVAALELRAIEIFGEPCEPE